LDATVTLLYVELVTDVCLYIYTLLATMTGSWEILLDSGKSLNLFWARQWEPCPWLVVMYLDRYLCCVCLNLILFIIHIRWDFCPIIRQNTNTLFGLLFGPNGIFGTSPLSRSGKVSLTYRYFSFNVSVYEILYMYSAESYK